VVESVVSTAVGAVVMMIVVNIGLFLFNQKFRNFRNGGN